jgi:alkylhydroperoxidase/carboxymuconolactone decarboxylase family protein YurZ
MRKEALITFAVLASRPEFHEELRGHILLIKANKSATWAECYECALQLYLFAGFPAALEAVRALHRAWPEEITLVMPSEVLLDSLMDDDYSAGQELYKKVYGAKSEIVREALTTLSPELAFWAVTEGYGKTLSRPGLDLVTRELAIVGMLTQLAWDRQLFSHIIGAKNVGASIDEITTAVRIGSRNDETKLDLGRTLLTRIK